MAARVHRVSTVGELRPDGIGQEFIVRRFRPVGQPSLVLGVRAIKAGLAPISVALILSTSWLLTAAHANWHHYWRLWLLTASALLLVWRTKVHLLPVLIVGAVLGAMGWV